MTSGLNCAVQSVQDGSELVPGEVLKRLYHGNLYLGMKAGSELGYLRNMFSFSKAP